MKVVSFYTDEEVNKFLNNENVKVESITPVSNESNGIIWALTYKEKVTVKRAIYRFGCGSHLGTMWSQTCELTDDEFDEKKKEFIEKEMPNEPWRFRSEIIKTKDFIEWR